MKRKDVESNCLQRARGRTSRTGESTTNTHVGLFYSSPSSLSPLSTPHFPVEGEADDAPVLHQAVPRSVMWVDGSDRMLEVRRRMQCWGSGFTRRRGLVPPGMIRRRARRWVEVSVGSRIREFGDGEEKGGRKSVSLSLSLSLSCFVLQRPPVMKLGLSSKVYTTSTSNIKPNGQARQGNSSAGSSTVHVAIDDNGQQQQQQQ